MPAALRVLHILPSLRPDGAERLAVHIVTQLDRRRFLPFVISINRPVGSDLERILADAGIQVWYLGKGRGFDARTFRRMHEAFSACRPDILHTHIDVLRYALPSLLRWRPKLAVHTVHNVAEHEMEWPGRIVQRIAYRRGVVPIAVAEELAKSVVRLYGLARCGVIRNCVPTLPYSHPKISRAEWRAANGFSQEDILFVCVARLTEQKNHALLLKAFAHACVAENKARLVLVGTGLLGPKLNSEAARLGVADRVHFMGGRTDIPELLGAMDAFALSSDWEGNPLSILEAMSAGLPVISTAVGGVPELFDDGVEGVMVQPGDVVAFSRAIRSLCQNGEARRAMGALGFARAQANFDVAEMVRAYEEVYAMRSAVPVEAFASLNHPLGYAALPKS